MTENLLIVVAEMSAKPGKESELRATLLGFVEPTRAEDGCVQYDLTEDNDRPGHFIFFERWQSKAHLDRHLASPHLSAAQPILPELLAEPMRLTLGSQIG